MIFPLWFRNIYLTASLLQPMSLSFKECTESTNTPSRSGIPPKPRNKHRKKVQHSHEFLCPQSQCFALFPTHKHTGCEGNGQIISFTTPPVLLNWSNKQQACPSDPLMFSCCTLQHQTRHNYKMIITFTQDWNRAFLNISLLRIPLLIPLTAAFKLFSSYRTIRGKSQCYLWYLGMTSQGWALSVRCVVMLCSPWLDSCISLFSKPWP